MRIALAVIFTLVSGSAFATSEGWYRTFFGHYAATLRYQQYGVGTPGLNDLYVNQIANFIKSDDVRLGVYFPSKTTMGAYGPEWTFFGARFLPLQGSGNPSFYGVSYLGSNVSFHNGDGFDAILSPANVATGLNAAPFSMAEAGPRPSHVAAHGYAHLNRSANYAPMSWNSADIDGDGAGDLAFGGMMYLSTGGYTTPGWSTSQIGAEVAFIQTPAGVRAARLNAGRLSVVRYQAGFGFIEEAMVQLSDVAVNVGHALTVMPGTGADRVIVRRACGLQIYTELLVPVACITGLSGNWALPGARGDFDADGVDDIWLSQTFQGDPAAPQNGHVVLISGALLAAASGNVTLASLTIARVDGSTQFSNYDGIATTLSPAAGDIDNDGKPDLTFSGHRHMSEAGAMYILLGKDIAPNLQLDITDSRIIKVVGSLMSQIAPPFHHWDATDWDGDGYDDIMVTADNDPRAGISAGAVHLLSGRLIIEAAQP